jgi:hypothetical protein
MRLGLAYKYDPYFSLSLTFSHCSHRSSPFSYLRFPGPPPGRALLQAGAIRFQKSVLSSRGRVHVAFTRAFERCSLARSPARSPSPSRVLMFFLSFSQKSITFVQRIPGSGAFDWSLGIMVLILTAAKAQTPLSRGKPTEKVVVFLPSELPPRAPFRYAISANTAEA